ncbi:MAG TPA: hypothetical protein VGG39_26345 [Polyangiaceae bacterium]|jgi:hypothetical protein
MPSIAPPGSFHGYHFHVRFFPKWATVASLLVKRARAVGLTVPDDGVGLEPRATSLVFSGTRWTRFKHGGLRFDVLEERRDLQGEIVCAAGNAGEHPTYAFGLANPGALRGPIAQNELALEMAVGLWLHGGSLTLRPREESNLGEEVIAEFQVWTALEALARVALGEPALGRPSSGTALVTKHTSPLWAPGFETTVAHREAEARARFSADAMNVMAQVDAILEAT